MKKHKIGFTALAILISFDIVVTVGYLIIKYGLKILSNPNPPSYQGAIASLYLFVIDWPISPSTNLIIDKYIGNNLLTDLWGLFYQSLFSNLIIAIASHTIIAYLLDSIVNQKKIIYKISLCVLLILFIISPFLLGFKI